MSKENKERVSCQLYFSKTYREGILNGTDPVLKEDLIPITLEDNGTVRKANLESPWYSYADKKWANAVILQNSYDALNAEGKVGGATKENNYVSFDGVDDSISLGFENYDFGVNFTLSLLVKINEYDNNITQMLLTNFENGGISLEYYKNQVYAAICKEDLSSYITTPRYNYVKGEYMLLTATYDGQSFKIYVNGNLFGETAYSGKIVKTIVPFAIGANPNPNNKFVQFSMIDVKQAAIYSRTLSAEEIKANMSDTIKVTNNDGLLSYVDFTNKKDYEDNEVIPEDVIESYFVWIPKYRYKLWDLGNYDNLTSIDTSKVHTIDVLFGDYNTSDENKKECTTPMKSGETGNCKVGDYMTHPSFLSIPSTGFWVGKFETGVKGSTTTLTDLDVSKIAIKPNTYGLISNLAVAHINAYDYKRSLDSHVMKNTEWGAVAYLSHSSYGSASNIRINNNSSSKTGYAANNESTCGYTGQSDSCNTYCNDETCNSPYNTSTGYLSSTTGNIYGVYDMSGMTTKVMGIMLDPNGQLYSGSSASYNSGFNGLFGSPKFGSDDGSITELTTGISYPDEKYYDAYNYNTTRYNYKIRILGDAMGEMGPYVWQLWGGNFGTAVTSWYGDLMDQNIATFPIIDRGYSCSGGTFSGIFALQSGYGRSFFFKLILTPTV